MPNEIQEEYQQSKVLLDQTLHRFKNNLQTQLSLMNIQSSTNRSYLDERKVIVDRIFALTHVYDIFYKSTKSQNTTGRSLVSLQSFMLQFMQYLNGSSSKIDYELKQISGLQVDLDHLLLLSYIFIELEDFRKNLDDEFSLKLSHKQNSVVLEFNFSSIDNHERFYDLFKDQFKILDLMVLQLKGKFEYKKKFVRLSFPIL